MASSKSVLPGPTRVQWLEAQVANISRVIAWIAVGCLLVVCVAVLIDVLMRWLFGWPIHGLEDINNIIVTVAIAACMPAAYGLRSHITVQFMGKLIGPRGAAVLDSFGHTLTLLFAAVVAWQIVIHVGDSAMRTTLILNLPVTPAWLGAAVFAAVAAAVQVIVLIATIASAWQTPISKTAASNS